MNKQKTNTIRADVVGKHVASTISFGYARGGEK